MDKKRPIYRLCLKNVPKSMKIFDLKKCCVKFGRVTDISDSQKTDYKFVDFATLGDMQEALKGFNENNPHGIVADIANASKNIIAENGLDSHNNNMRSNADFVNGGGKGGVNKNDYMNSNNKNGSSINSYKNNSNKIRKCVLCNKNSNKTCSRCGDFYCSIECQTKDWQNHRYICVPMPKLIDITDADNNHNDNDCDDGVATDIIVNNNKNNKLNNEIINNNDIKYSFEKQIIDDKNLSKNIQTNNLSLSNIDNSVKIVTPTTSNKNFSTPPMSNGQDNISQNNNNNNSSSASQDNNKKQTAGKITISNLPPNGSCVVLTTIMKSNLFFIRSIDTNNDYIKILQIINDTAKNSKFIENLPKKGELLLAEYDDGIYYRALVQSVENENHITVMFIDFGNIENVQKAKLKLLPIELLNFECYAVPVRIKNVPDTPLTEKVINYLDNYLDCIEKQLQIIYSPQNNENDNKIYVELKDIETNEIINEKIIELLNNNKMKENDIKNNAKTDDNMTKDNTTTSFITMKNIEHNLIPDAESIELVVFDNSLVDDGYITCIQQKYINPLIQFCEKLKIYAESNNEFYRPRVSELCVVLCIDDDNWYRAECTNIIDKDKYEILFVDFGNKMIVNVDNIRKYPNGNEFMYPCYTNICIIADLPDKLNSATVARIQDLIPSNENISITKICHSSTTKFGERNLIYIPDIIKKLKFERLI